MIEYLLLWFKSELIVLQWMPLVATQEVCNHNKKLQFGLLTYITQKYVRIH